MIIILIIIVVEVETFMAVIVNTPIANNLNLVVISSTLPIKITMAINFIVVEADSFNIKQGKVDFKELPFVTAVVTAAIGRLSF